MRNNRRKMVIFKRVASWMLVFAMLVCWIPSVASADEVTNTQTGTSVRATIYFSISGDDSKDGLTPENAKQDIMLVPQYLAQGYNVSLKRGDTWYLPDGRWDLSNLTGSADSPLIIGAYGDENAAKPIVAFLKPIADSAWTLVEGTENVYVADISDMQANTNPVANLGVRVFRTFVNGGAYRRMACTYSELGTEEFCEHADGYVYVKTSGGAPTNVELLPYNDTVEGRVYMTNTSHLTIQDINIKGGCNGYDYFFCVRLTAPTAYITFDSVDFTYTSGYILNTTSYTSATNYKLVIANCLFDSMLSVKEGSGGSGGGAWDVGTHEGINLTGGALEAWIHHNVMRNMSHAAIEIGHGQRTSYPEIPGVHYCVFEDNYIEGVNACYARSFAIQGGKNGAGEELTTYNIIRRNQCYDQTTSIHLYGENNAFYSNLISYTYNRKNASGEYADGKSPQPWGIDTWPWSDQTSKGNIVLNNTFYDLGGGIILYDSSGTVDNNLYANNLIVNWGDSNSSKTGAIYDHTVATTYVMNNGMYTEGRDDALYIKGKVTSVADAEAAKPNYSGNIVADPLFETADLSVIGIGHRQDYALSDASPYRYAGLSLNADVYKNFPIWKLIKDEYTDINGNAYLVETPSIGAYSYNKTLSGKVASVEAVKGYTVRTGTPINTLAFPSALDATLTDGTTVILPVTWNTDSYKADQAGTYTLVGTLNTSAHAELDINGVTAACTIVVKDKMELNEVLSSVKDVAVPYGTTLEEALAKLPATVSVREEGDFIEDIPITWTCKDGYYPTWPDYYTFTGAINGDLVTNPEIVSLEVKVRVLKYLEKGMEILSNPDFNDGESYDPWMMQWESGKGNAYVTTDPNLVLEGESGAAVVVANGRYGSIGQDVVDEMQYLGNGKYLFRVYMRALKEDQPITTSYACLKIWGNPTIVLKTDVQTNIGTEYVKFEKIFDVTDLETATEVSFHTSTGKGKIDIEKPYVIAGCSLVYLGKDDAEAAATLDKMGLSWEAIKGENTSDKSVTSNLVLPTQGENGSTITWASSNEAVIAANGTVTRTGYDQEVTLTATIKNGEYTDTVKFTVVVPGDEALRTYVVTYVADGNTVKTEVVAYGKDASAPEIPAKTGYTAAWDKDGKNITADTTITAVYTANKYTVTYVADGKTVNTQTVEYGKDASAPEIPAKAGYTGAWDKDGKNITADTTINVVYTRIPTTDGPDKTGDNSHVALMAVLMLTALAGLAVTTLYCQNNGRKARK